MNATFFIPRENESRFLEALTKLAKLAKKLGLAAITYTAVKTLPIERTRYRYSKDDAGVEHRETITRTIEHVAYTVVGESPTLAGWEFVGTLEHIEGVTILRTITEEPIPERFRTASPKDCDHCGYVRDRSDTFVVRSVETGEFKQVGRSCLKDFLGNKSPGTIAAYLTQLEDFLGAGFYECGDYEPGMSGPRPVETFALVGFLAVTVAAIKGYGWISRTMAKDSWDGTVSTADVVLDHIDAASNPKLTPEQRKDRSIPGADREENFELARAAVEWAKAEDATGSDYIHNLHAICELDYVTGRTAGYAASIMSGYFRHTDRALRREILKADGVDHVGTIGKREELLLTLIAVFYTESEWGTTAIHKFADPNGNAVTWFASNDEIVPCSVAHPHPDYPADPEGRKTEMVKGATYRVKATVKAHGEYKGQAQTTVTRVAVQPIVLKPKKKRARRKKKTTEVSA